MTKAANWLLYGANGYTGELCAEAAKARGMTPTLAGRRADTVRPIAERLGLPWKVFPLDDPAAVDEGLRGFQLVLHCAGPFSATARPMIEGCVRQQAHYLDITGEIAVYEENFRRSAEYERAGIVVMSGVGFDVVPTDCMAAALARALPGAQSLELAFGGYAKLSKGTATTMVEGLSQGGAVRRGGKLVRVASAHEARTIRFDDKDRYCMAIPWGDVSTAYYTTGIPDITVFTASSPGMVRGARLLAHLAPLLSRPSVQKLVKGQIAQRVKGPDEAQRQSARVNLWGRAVTSDGRSVEGVGQVPEGYALTALASIEITARLLADPAAVKPGARTPAGAFGPELLTSLPGCTLRVPR